MPIQEVIHSYTREAGVRNLEREIAAICRGVAKDVAAGSQEKVGVSPENLHKFLGPVKFFPEVAERTSEPGVATGLAWTPTGGDIIFVEATKMRGREGAHPHGQLGDVMKESAQAALLMSDQKRGSWELTRSFLRRPISTSTFQREPFPRMVLRQE